MKRKGKDYWLTEEQINFVRKNYPYYMNAELIEMSGMSRSSLVRIQEKYHLRKSAKLRSEINTLAGKKSNIARGGRGLNAYTPEVIAKRVATRKKTYKLEQARALFGLEQETKMKVRREPKAKVDQRSYLKQHGYIIDNIEMIAYYTPETHRATRLEAARAGKKSRFRSYYSFKSYESEKDNC